MLGTIDISPFQVRTLRSHGIDVRRLPLIYLFISFKWKIVKFKLFTHKFVSHFFFPSSSLLLLLFVLLCGWCGRARTQIIIAH